ncbi:MAG: ABC transporter permease [Rhodospirillales bacterium]|nr:ABC transporter permease [Rhodospirillales bacterium]
MELFTSIFVGIIIAATPLVFAAIGEVVVERSGVLNLGVEGMIIIGALAGFAFTVETGSFSLGVIASMVAGAAMAFLFAVLTQSLMTNQVATGLALTMFGLGLSALLGQGYSGKSVPTFPKVDIPYLSDLPFIGDLFFKFDILVYLSIALVIGVLWFFEKTRTGLTVRAIGDNHHAAHSIGYSVKKYRYLTIMFGGACAGIGGAYLSLVLTPLWVENMSSGRGWIALALVVFGAWQPVRAMLGAYLFGGITILQLHSQGFGITIDPQLLSMLPYLATIVVLVLISRETVKSKMRSPACLGTPFYASQ